MKRSLASAILSFLLAEQCGAHADVSAIVRKFESAYRSSRTLRADFIEKYTDNGKLVRSDAGVAYFLKPGKMRWEYQSPETNLYLVDGKWSWFYVPVDHTATRIAAKHSADSRTLFALLAGEVKVSKLCASVDREPSVASTHAGGVVLRCTFRDEESQDARQARSSGSTEPGTAFVLFEVDSATGELIRLMVHDPGGTQVEFQFANWQFNPPMAPSLFHFQPPKGVAIVDGSLPEGRGVSGNRP